MSGPRETQPTADKSVVKGEPVYPSIPPGTLVWFWPGARPEGRKVLAKTMSSRDKFTGTITYRVEFYDDDGGLHSDYAAWMHVEPVYQGDRVGAAVTGGRIARAGRYDEEGRLVEVVEAGEDGRVDIPTSGLWYVQVVAE